MRTDNHDLLYAFLGAVFFTGLLIFTLGTGRAVYAMGSYTKGRYPWMYWYQVAIYAVLSLLAWYWTVKIFWFSG